MSSDKPNSFFKRIITKIGEIAALSIREELEGLRQAIHEQNKKIDENEKDRIRWQILDFANSCRNGRDHTKDEFQHIMVLNDKYKKLLQTTNDINGVFDIEYKYITELFSKKLEGNDFLDTRK